MTRFSLRRRFLGPLLVGGAAVAIVAAWMIYTFTLSQLRADFAQRGDIIAEVVVQLARAAQGSQEGTYQNTIGDMRLAINQLVTVEPNVLSVMVATKEPFLIQVSSDHDVPRAGLPLADALSAVREALDSGGFGYRFGARGDLTVLRPLPTSDLELGTMLTPTSVTDLPGGGVLREFEPSTYRGVILLRLDWESVRAASTAVLWQSVAVSLAAVMVLVLLAVYLLHRTVLRPLDVIRITIEQIEVGQRGARVPRLVEDEVGRVAEILNRLLDDTDAYIDEQRRTEDALEHRVQMRTAELRRAQNDLVENARLAAMGQLTATVSHELRNPLSTILTSLSTLERVLEERDPDLLRPVERAVRGVGRCRAIIDELLDFTRNTTLDRQPGHLDPWLDELLDEYGMPADVELHRDLGSGDLELAFDRERMRRVMVNLLDNAAAAVEEGRRARRVAGRVAVSTRLVDGTVAIEVRDNGAGIEPGHLGQIFEPLFTTKTKGIGLGLPNVRRILELHGGSIRARSTRGEGTSMLVTLPVSK